MQEQMPAGTDAGAADRNGLRGCLEKCLKKCFGASILLFMS